MTPENQPEPGMVKKAYGIIKAGGHSFKRATLGDIYSLIETRADEAKEHSEENFRYLNTKIDNQIGEVRQEIGQVRQEIGAVRQEIGAVNQRIDNLGQKIDTQIGDVNKRIDNLGQRLDARMDTLDRKIDTQTGEVNKRLDSIMQMLIGMSKQIIELSRQKN
jgi:tetrahydromethanopterin S-methyltransferase subunit G